MPNCATKSGHDAEHAGVVIKMMLHEIVEAVGAERSPRARDDHGELAASRREFHLDTLSGALSFSKAGRSSVRSYAGRERRGGLLCGGALARRALGCRRLARRWWRRCAHRSPASRLSRLASRLRRDPKQTCAKRNENTSPDESFLLHCFDSLLIVLRFGWRPFGRRRLQPTLFAAIQVPC